MHIIYTIILQYHYIVFYIPGLFEIRNIEKTAAEIFAAKPLVAQYGNYSLQIQAQDRGFPPNSVLSHINICVLDFNDHAPEFVSPSENVTIKVPEVCKGSYLYIVLCICPYDIHKQQVFM